MSSKMLIGGVFAVAFLGGCDYPNDHDPGDMTHTRHLALSSADMGDPLQDDTAYLTRLALLRGHLSVGMALYEDGRTTAAAGHMKTPNDLAYRELAPAISARGAPGFADELAAFARSVEAGAPRDRVRRDFEVLKAAMEQAEQGADQVRAASLAKIIGNIAGNLAQEYNQAVEATRIASEHEYQDALGFLAVAEALTDELRQHGEAGETVTRMEEELAYLRAALPGLETPEAVQIAPSEVAAAASRLQKAARLLENSPP